MDDCGKMDQTDWDFLIIDNEVLVKAIDRWRVQPLAKKSIDNIWAPQVVRTGGKRKIRSTSED